MQNDDDEIDVSRQTPFPEVLAAIRATMMEPVKPYRHERVLKPLVQEKDVPKRPHSRNTRHQKEIE